MSESRPPAKLFLDRRFGPYLGGNFVSNIGNWFQNVAAGIVVFQLTGSNTLVGMVSVLQFAATLALAPWSGALADRLDRRKMLMLAQGISASGALALAVWVGLVGVDGLPGVWPVLAASGVIGVGFAVGISAMNALVPALVAPSDLDDAIALNSATFTLARAVGPALAGVVIATLGAALAFGANVLTFLPLILVLGLTQPREVERSSGDRSVKAGLMYTRDRPAMPWLILATLAVGWAGDPVNTLAPAYADLFGRGETFVGFQVAAFGTGSAVSSLGVGAVRVRIRPTADHSPRLDPPGCRSHRLLGCSVRAHRPRFALRGWNRLPARCNDDQQQPPAEARRRHAWSRDGVVEHGFLGLSPSGRSARRGRGRPDLASCWSPHRCAASDRGMVGVE